MNNIFFNQPDPILASREPFQYQPQTIPNSSYYPMNDYIPGTDWLGELDKMTSSLGKEELGILGANQEYLALASSVQQSIQDEIMALVKSRLNTRQDIVENIKKQMNIINGVRDSVDRQQRQDISELNDYMKNYSHLTFDEYKKFKNGEIKPKKNNKETK